MKKMMAQVFSLIYIDDEIPDEKISGTIVIPLATFINNNKLHWHKYRNKTFCRKKKIINESKVELYTTPTINKGKKGTYKK